MSKNEIFKGVTIILPVINETYSLIQTVETIEKTCEPSDIEEFLIVVCEKTTSQSLAVCNDVVSRLGQKARLYFQKLPFIGGAMREAFNLANGSHTVMMSTDLETDPAIVQNFIILAKKNPHCIITASRWIDGGGFVGYSKVKLVSNYAFQKLFSFIYGCYLTDLTYAYRLFPTSLIKAIKWEELRHPFFLETIIKPLRLGIKVIEIPTVWSMRTEGVSQNPFFANFSYFKIAWKVRFLKKENILNYGNTDY